VAAPDLILASRSPRRRLLLSAAGYHFTTAVPDVDETRLADEDAATMVLRLSAAKARAVETTNTVILAADTVVVRDGVVLGKPEDKADAVRTLATLVGRSHSVLTGWTVLHDGEERFGVAESLVRFADRTVAELEGYVERTDPIDKAGSYALQGDDGWLVTEVVGSRANVMGLPLAAVVEALTEFGIERTMPTG
jgi:septum formation protein